MTAGSQSTFKEVTIAPLDAKREATGLLAAILVIGILMTVRFVFVQSTVAEAQLKPYQRFDTTLKGQSPVLYRSLLSIVDELIYLQEQAGIWPTVESLEAEHLPPFDRTFLPVGLKSYEWSRHLGTSWVDYFGHRSVTENESLTADERKVFLLRIIDLHTKDHPHPHQGVDYDPNIRYAPQVWLYPEDRTYTPQKQLPEKGWKWIVSASQSSQSADNPVISEKADENTVPEILEALEGKD